MKTLALSVCASLTLLTLISVRTLNAQSCGFDEDQQVPLTQLGGYQITSSGTVKALLIFIDFSDDNSDPQNPT